MKTFMVSLVVLCIASVGQASTVEFFDPPTIASLQYRATGSSGWSSGTVNGGHGQFQTGLSLVDVSLGGVWASHDFSGMPSGAFVTVVGKEPTQWAFNYDNYIGDEVTRWLPINVGGGTGVPEPSTVLLGLLGIAGLSVVRRY